MRGMAESNNEKWKMKNEKLDLHSIHANAGMKMQNFGLTLFSPFVIMCCLLIRI